MGTPPHNRLPYIGEAFPSPDKKRTPVFRQRFTGCNEYDMIISIGRAARLFHSESREVTVMTPLEIYALLTLIATIIFGTLNLVLKK